MPEVPEPDDRTLIARILRGEPECFRLLVERYQDGIFRLIVKQVGDEAQAEDLVQESFLRAFKGLKSFRLDASFKTWITRIGLNVTNSHFASRAYRQKLSHVELEPERHVQPAAEYDPVMDRDLKLLQIAIGRLSDKYRSVVALCILEEKPYQEAAEILGIPVGTVGSRMHKALALLHTEFWKVAHDKE